MNSRDYWDGAHKSGDLEALTGNTLGSHLKALGVENVIEKHSSVLCIGVGTGEWIRELSGLLNKDLLVAIDISGVAREKVAPVAATFSPDAFSSIALRDYFDLALSLWVAPHMRTDHLRHQLKAVVPSLKKTGIFAIHYNEPFPGTVFDEVEFVARWANEAAALSAGLMRMTERQFSTIVAEAGGRVTHRSVWHPAPEYDENCCVAHVMRT